MRYLNFLLILCTIFLFITNSFSEEIDKEFNIKPEGNLDTVELALDNYKCIFSFAATGGTNENWRISLSSENGNAICFIGRPKPTSYLYFKEFSGQLINTKTGKSNIVPDVSDNSGSLPLGDQYIVTSDNKVVQSKNFAGNLALLVLSSE
ncbi:hypothetical protein RB653_004335 [Dictyostelium firmibasis]|uniref:Uncharacterized protein n=1 Tax=Dictyostelium firmibasis TaxID=79012 RepID=A0AAN7TZG9_9MYCE